MSTIQSNVCILKGFCDEIKCDDVNNIRSEYYRVHFVPFVIFHKSN